MDVCLRRGGSSEGVALTAAKVITGRCASAKGKSLGIIKASSPLEKKPAARDSTKGSGATAPVVQLSGHRVPLVKGLAAAGPDGAPLDPTAVRRYLESSFKDKLGAVRAAMEKTAASYTKQELKENAMSLYERFRPAWKGWGVPGELHLKDIAAARK
eukprot:gnl/TRDRNA2_/TRDRNA2_163577_c0_seq2.p2 gnl/TRDRNA2_/TRDRNA2_163577_c0~~gnl/TRDRNA2_/TRDRNA2_163577_c0_seq2.p2  ORF type:complete len:157 (+),score=32.14 gnl/TRDRNA2_/TRDRNA2_163577_c0_seq2:229-699(+)